MYGRWCRSILAGVVTSALAGASVLLTATPALAAPGDASARGVVFNLNGAVLGVPVVRANRTFGAADAPPGGGTDTSTNVPVVLDPTQTVGVTGGGRVDEVTATRGPLSSSALARVTGAGVGILGVNAVTTGDVTATVTCPVVGANTATTTVTGLVLFGQPTTVAPNSPPVTRGAAVNVPGLTGARLTGTVQRTETVTAGGAFALALTVTFALTATAPTGPVTIPLGTVRIAQASCNRPTPPPVVATGITPASGPSTGGQTVRITGSGFLPGTTVTFDGVPATRVTATPDGTSLTAVTPAGAVGSAAVVVRSLGGASAPLGYTYLAGGEAPQVTGVTPRQGPTSGGSTVTITGTGLTGATGVTFGGVPATGVTVNATGTAITATTPAAARPGTVPVVVRFRAGTAAAGPFTYVAPTIGRVSPGQGPAAGGTRVRITGTGLRLATGVTFDGRPGTGLTRNADGSLSVTTPPGVAGSADVAVLLPGADAVARGAFRYLLAPILPAPIVAGPTAGRLDPASGPTAGGTSVTVHGTGLVPGATVVYVCGVTIPADRVRVNPAGTTAAFVTPACAAGTVGVVLGASGGRTSPLPFTYLGPALAVTGANVTGPAWTGVLLLVVGVALLGGVRWRSTRTG